VHAHSRAYTHTHTRTVHNHAHLHAARRAAQGSPAPAASVPAIGAAWPRRMASACPAGSIECTRAHAHLLPAGRKTDKRASLPSKGPGSLFTRAPCSSVTRLASPCKYTSGRVGARTGVSTRVGCTSLPPFHPARRRSSAAFAIPLLMKHLTVQLASGVPTVLFRPGPRNWAN